jgi:hypothetical protein
MDAALDAQSDAAAALEAAEANVKNAPDDAAAGAILAQKKKDKDAADTVVEQAEKALKKAKAEAKG